MDGGEQLWRCLSYIDRGATEEENCNVLFEIVIVYAENLDIKERQRVSCWMLNNQSQYNVTHTSPFTIIHLTAMLDQF
jgi:hypothetical protein